MDPDLGGTHEAARFYHPHRRDRAKPHIAAFGQRAGVAGASLAISVRTSDLPVMQPAKFELVLNSTTAKTLRVEIPPKLLVLADRVVE